MAGRQLSTGYVILPLHLRILVFARLVSSGLIPIRSLMVKESVSRVAVSRPRERELCTRLSTMKRLPAK
jgi:hypothetical protein